MASASCESDAGSVAQLAQHVAGYQKSPGSGLPAKRPRCRNGDKTRCFVHAVLLSFSSLVRISLKSTIFCMSRAMAAMVTPRLGGGKLLRLFVEGGIACFAEFDDFFVHEQPCFATDCSSLLYSALPSSV